jgi:RNA polymerase sigma-70 factor (ECF subfamily)
MREAGDHVVESTALEVEARAEIDFKELYRAHARTVSRWAARLGGPGIEPEDVVHEVFLVAKRRLRQFEGDAKITTWLFRTTQKTVASLRRKQRVRRLLSQMLSRQVLEPEYSVSTPVDDLERAEVARTVYRVLDQLAERERQVLVLFEMEGMSTEQMADMMGAKVATVRVWLHRARARFTILYEAANHQVGSAAREARK